MSATVDLDLLADYVGGAISDPAEAARVAELVAHDPQWRAAATALTEAMLLVQDDLAVLSGQPEPMPDDIAARFDDLFAGPEFATRPTGTTRPASTGPAAPRTGSAGGPGERPLTRRPAAGPGRRRWLMPVAAAAGVAAIAAVALPALISSLPGATTMQDASTGGEAPASTMAAPGYAASGRYYSKADFLTATRMTTGSSETGRPELSKSRGPAGLPWSDRLSDLSAPPELKRLSTSPGALDACLNAVTQARPGQVTSIDFAHFEQVPALIIFIAAGAEKWVVIAGQDCGSTGADELYRAADR